MIAAGEVIACTCVGAFITMIAMIIMVIMITAGVVIALVGIGIFITMPASVAGLAHQSIRTALTVGVAVRIEVAWSDAAVIKAYQVASAVVLVDAG